MSMVTSEVRFAICVQNQGYGASLELRKIYQVLPDDAASAHGLIRILDESGEDYLYPQDYFCDIVLPEAVAARMLRMAA